MEIMTDQRLLAEVEAFLELTGMAPSRFGLEAMGDGALVRQLREGNRSLSLKNAERVLTYIAERRSTPITTNPSPFAHPQTPPLAQSPSDQPTSATQINGTPATPTGDGTRLTNATGSSPSLKQSCARSDASEPTPSAEAA